MNEPLRCESSLCLRALWIRGLPYSFVGPNHHSSHSQHKYAFIRASAKSNCHTIEKMRGMTYLVRSVRKLRKKIRQEHVFALLTCSSPSNPTTTVPRMPSPIHDYLRGRAIAELVWPAGDCSLGNKAKCAGAIRCCKGWNVSEPYLR